MLAWEEPGTPDIRLSESRPCSALGLTTCRAPRSPAHDRDPHRSQPLSPPCRGVQALVPGRLRAGGGGRKRLDSSRGEMEAAAGHPSSSIEGHSHNLTTLPFGVENAKGPADNIYECLNHRHNDCGPTKTFLRINNNVKQWFSQGVDGAVRGGLTMPPHPGHSGQYLEASVVVTTGLRVLLASSVSWGWGGQGCCSVTPGRQPPAGSRGGDRSLMSANV